MENRLHLSRGLSTSCSHVNSYGMYSLLNSHSVRLDLLPVPRTFHSIRPPTLWPLLASHQHAVNAIFDFLDRSFGGLELLLEVFSKSVAPIRSDRLEM